MNRRQLLFGVLTAPLAGLAWGGTDKARRGECTMEFVGTLPPSSPHTSGLCHETITDETCQYELWEVDTDSPGFTITRIDA